MPMSQNIIEEITFLLHSILLGIIITFVYDGFLILRRLIRHSILLISLEDMIFWIACAIGVFYMLYEENNGILRWFAVFGATIGMIVYKKTISTLIVNVMSTIIQYIFKILFKMFRIFIRPIAFIGKKTGSILGKIRRKLVRIGKYVKNKLTGRLKLLRITLCKR